MTSTEGPTWAQDYSDDDITWGPVVTIFDEEFDLCMDDICRNAGRCMWECWK